MKRTLLIFNHFLLYFGNVVEVDSVGKELYRSAKHLFEKKTITFLLQKAYKMESFREGKNYNVVRKSLNEEFREMVDEVRYDSSSLYDHLGLMLE